MDRHDKSDISAQKNTFALDPAWGSLKKDVKGQVAKNNNRPPDKQKRAYEETLKGSPGSPSCFPAFPLATLLPPPRLPSNIDTWPITGLR
ncbi:hypothetical protein ALQ04_100786 [Pseudomonas cichorii]|uniref:Uncharacterized protein n=1 Tax=Pseudomonas cichorii TaxID=36746 RepID=A0A3M4LP55_PSECI|nr:hypothetical protein ALQ04_100786 [Pseudomonas cichorii]